MKLRKQMEVLIEEMLDGQILLGEAIHEFEKVYIEKCLSRHGSHLSKSAKVLGIHRNTLSKRVASYEKSVGNKIARQKSA